MVWAGLSGQCRPTAVGYGRGWARIKCAESAVTDLAKKHNGTPDRQEKEHGIVGNKDRIYGPSTKCVLGF